ncbi:hypothetical protein DICVIV_03189 [Dictyocaulus viviparus]|uniref:Translation initiation factor eIF2B subunit epsilon n=1 Tax=Dictyocaulus viviparus TaxID=29172 RepID=A0A0D8Y3U6_DICVI|nr:hypothetical protein DICVIV_03189 [Dictyocaulus viviparus]
MSCKKEQRRDSELVGVVIADSYDARFAPLLSTIGPWARDFLLLSNPATFTSATLQSQIAAFRRVHHFISDTVVRRDIMYSGIALCSLNISAQFSDNFDFQHLDDVIRDILVNEEILLQSIHVEVLSSFEAAFCVSDYDSLLLASKLIMERWFFPMVPDRMASARCLGLSALSRNVYVSVSEQDFGKLVPVGNVSKRAFNSTFGVCCEVDGSAFIACSTIGSYTNIGSNTFVLNCIIGENCIIGADCRLEESILGSNVRIPNGTSLSKQSVVSSEVVYPPDLDVPLNSAICAKPPCEYYEDFIEDKVLKGIYIWTLTDGGSFWNSSERRDSRNGSTGEEDGMETSTESEEFDQVESDATSHFYEEVVESMERIQGLTFSDQQMHNLILEINSSKLAYNISMEDVAKYVFFAFLGLPGNETWTKLKELCQKWILLFKNYYKPRKSQIQLLLAIEDRFKRSSVKFRPLVARLVHFLYNDMDILEEESILEWVESLDEKWFELYEHHSLLSHRARVYSNRLGFTASHTCHDLYIKEHLFLDQKQQKAAVVIQRCWRAHKARVDLAQMFRNSFDITGRPTTKETLNLQITRMNVFYHHPDDDCRLVELCSAALGLFRIHKKDEISIAPQRRMVFYKCLFTYLSRSGKDSNFVMPIRYKCFITTKFFTDNKFVIVFRFLETFIHPQDCVFLAKAGYFDCILSLITKLVPDHQLLTPLMTETRPSPRIESLCEMLMLPILQTTLQERVLVLRYLMRSICINKVVVVMVEVVIPYFSRCLCNAVISPMEVLNAFGDHPSLETLPSGLMSTYFLSVLLDVYDKYDINDDEKSLLLSTCASYKHAMEQVHENECITFGKEVKSFIMTAMNTVFESHTFLALCKHGVLFPTDVNVWSLVIFEKQILNSEAVLLLATSYPCMNRLWHLLVNLESQSPTGCIANHINLLKMGHPLDDESRDKLTQALSLFCGCLVFTISSIDDADFVSGHPNLVFSGEKLTEIITVIRDVGLGLIDLAFPDDFFVTAKTANERNRSASKV